MIQFIGMKYAAMIIVASIITLLGLIIGVARAEAPTLTEKELYVERLDEWLIKLSEKENCGRGIIDTNGRWSRGAFCFQDATYKKYSKELGVTDQFGLARAMIIDDYDNWTHWRCSVKPSSKCPAYTFKEPIGLPPK